MKKYKDAGKAKIEKDKLTAAQVEALDYAGTAALCGVKLGAKGESPEDFFYEHIRRDLANEVRDEARTAMRDKQKLTLSAAIAGNSDFAGLTVKETPDGKWEIS